MRAVVWTDVVQTGVYLLGGVSAMWLLGNGVEGGWSAILSGADAQGKLQLIDTYTGIDRPHTLWAGLIGGAFLSMASHGADQIIVQRLMASGSLADARKSLIGSGLVVLAQFGMFLLIGTGLHAFYKGEAFARPDAIFPRFIVEVMPPGLTGLVIAAILAAAMSTVSGALNSLAAATLHDLYLPLTGKKPEDPGVLRIGKAFTLMWAAILIGGAMLYRNEGTPVVTIALSIASFTYGGLLGAFFLAMLVPRAVQRDAITGMAVGIGTMSVVVFAKALSGWFPDMAPTLALFARIAWPWYVLIGTSLTFVTGLLSSYTHARPAKAPANQGIRS
jgi:Na+/proline symporter